MLLLYLKSGLDLASGNEGFKVNKKDSSETKTANVFVVAIGWILLLIGILFAVIPAILNKNGGILPVEILPKLLNTNVKTNEVNSGCIKNQSGPKIVCL